MGGARPVGCLQIGAEYHFVHPIPSLAPVQFQKGLSVSSASLEHLKRHKMPPVGKEMCNTRNEDVFSKTMSKGAAKQRQTMPA